MTLEHRCISLSNEVKVVKMGTIVTSLEVTSTFALAYLVTLKKVTRFYSSITFTPLLCKSGHVGHDTDC